MGMYTELYLSVNFKKDIPKEVEVVLMYLFSESGEYPLGLPDHKFFGCDRWQCVGNQGSFYFTPFSVSKIVKKQGSFYLTTRSDFKNYGKEIEEFLDWVRPFLDETIGTHIGHIRYENDTEPTLLYME